MSRYLLIALAVLWLCIAVLVVLRWPDLAGVEYPGGKP